MGRRFGNHRRSGRAGERGQVAILFALVFTFMLLLFAFVVDFGHLIQTKINLQLAADSAAYAGAAWQARILNQMGMVNYHLRQDVKELTMRAGVTHLRHNFNYPRGAGFVNGPVRPLGTEPEIFMCQQAAGYRSLSGLQYSPETNLCKSASAMRGGLPPIAVPPVIAAFDPFVVAIISQIRRIQVEANRECRAAADDNRQLAVHLVRAFTARSQFHGRQIESLAAFLNSINNQTPASSNHPAVASAYQSALRNLSRSNATDFRMDILQPSGGKYVEVTPKRLAASLFYMDFNVRGDGCVGNPGILDFNDMIAHYSKTPAIVTYFAVKLTAKPQLFFMPAAWAGSFPELVAFSVAKPFGSRMGPPDSTTADAQLPVPNRPGNARRTLNFSVGAIDNIGFMNTKLLAYLDFLHPVNSASQPDGNRNTGWPEPFRANNRLALQAVRAPFVFDAISYPIFPDPVAPGDQEEPNIALALYPDYLEAAGPDNQLINTPTPPTAPYLPTDVGSRNRGAGWIQINADRQAAGAYDTYATEEPGSHSVTTAVGLPLITEESSRQFGFATRGLLHSSWAPVDRPGGAKGRVGYSVKHVGMDILIRSLQVEQNASGTLGPIQNPPTGDPNITRVLH